MSIENRPKVGIGVYIVKDDKVLLGERIGSHQANTFCAPGGHLEYGESWEECAKRETLEETGLRIENIRFMGITNDVMKEDKVHSVTISMLADWKSGEPKIMEPDKCLGWKWYSYDEIPERKSAFLASFLESDFVDKLKGQLNERNS